MTLSKTDFEHYDPADFVPGVPDTLINVTNLNGDAVQWSISQDLTDSCGEINYYALETKPLHELLSQPAVLEALRDQMIDEITFISRKDGVFGLLFEVERECIESDGLPPPSGWKPPSREDLMHDLLVSMKMHAHCFPSVEFCIPCPSQIYKDRVGVWAFVPNGTLSEDALAELADYLQHI
jgi:hypothetical protein